VTFVRVTRDQRGYENTFLLHSPRPGERPRVLYWYRSAPGVRVGRPALDETAIRIIEEQYPDVDFDWPQLLEQASTIIPDVERRPERRRRPTRARELAPADQTGARSDATIEAEEEVEPEADARADAGLGPEEEFAPEPVAAQTPPKEPAMTTTTPLRPAPVERVERWINPLLAQLVGRDIARRLQARYSEIILRINEGSSDDATRSAWLARAEQIDPDRWTTPEAILHGIEHADALYEELRRDVT
jgi:hypothetical protein